MSRRSARNFFRKASPRTMQQLQNEYDQLCGQVGALSFQIDMLNAQLSNIKKNLVSTVNETQARRELDAKNPPKPTPAATSAPVQATT